MTIADQAVRDESVLPLDAVDVSDPAIYQNDTWQPLFARLRREDPVHYCARALTAPTGR